MNRYRVWAWAPVLLDLILVDTDDEYDSPGAAIRAVYKTHWTPELQARYGKESVRWYAIVLKLKDPSPEELLDEALTSPSYD